MNYPIYHFSCGCSHGEDSENMSNRFYDSIKKRTSFRRRCKEHPDSNVVEKSCICENERCKKVFRCSIKANNLRYCKECRPDLAVKRQRMWRKRHQNHTDRYKEKNENENENEKLVEILEPIIYPEVDRTDLSPCIQGDGCSYKDCNKNNKVCIKCYLRTAYIKYNFPDENYTDSVGSNF